MALRIEQLLSQLLGRVAPGIQTEDPMLTSVLQWFGSVQEQAMDRWRVVARSGARCALFRGNGAIPIPCDHPAVGMCSLCRDFVCLPHSAVSMGGNLACLRCMAELGKIAQGRVRAQPATPPAPQTPPAQRPVEDEQELTRRHLKTLGISKSVSGFDEVRAQYRKLALKHHPDRAPAHKRDAASKKMAQINAAYEWLDKHMRKVA